MTPLPYETSVEDVIVRIESRLSENPNVREKISATLKNGPRTFRVATLYEIINPDTQGAPSLVLEDHFHRPVEVEGLEYQAG